MKILSRKATMVGGRRGKLTTENKDIDLQMVPPKEMGGTGEGADPESLFVAGYVSCLASSMEYLLTKDNVAYDDLTMEGRVDLNTADDGGFVFALDVSVSTRGLEKSQAQTYLEKAKNFCPYSKAIAGNVTVNLSLTAH